MKKPTIYDVAREAGVSLATVSRVVNQSSVVKETTKNKVLKAIDKLDFKPNDYARGLATSKSTTIAIVFPQSMFSNIEEMIGGIGDLARHLDYNVNMYTSDDIGDGNVNDEITERIVKARVDGVILFNNKNIDKSVKLIDKYKIPMVVIGKKMSGERIGSIYFDIKEAIGQLVDTFIANGKKDILYVLPHQNLINNKDLIAGAKASYKKFSIPFDETKIFESSTHYQNNLPKFTQYFKYNKHEVVICGHDKDGVAIINAARNNGIKIPDEMEVVGMLNAEYSMMCQPTLSSLTAPIYDMGAMAVRLLTKFLNDEDVESKAIAIKHQFIKRESTK